MFKSEEFEKRQFVSEKIEELKDKKGMDFAKAKMELLQFCKDEEIDENIGKLVDVKDMDKINLTDDISFKNVHLVTRELEVGDRGDSFEVYELYDKDGNLLLTTDKDRNIIAEPILKEMYTEEQITELQSKVMIRMTKEINDRGDKKQFIAISDKLGKDQMLSQEDMDKVRDNTVYNELEDDEEEKEKNNEDKEELTEEQIEEKTGGHIIDIIEDPNFYQIAPGAKYMTFLIEIDGQYKFVDGQGNEIKGIEQLNMSVNIDDRKTENYIDKKEADLVFSTGRNDNDLVFAFGHDGAMHVVDRMKETSYQIDTAGKNTEKDEQNLLNEEVTENDEIAEYMGESDLTEQDIIRFLQEETKPMYIKDELFKKCIDQKIRKGNRRAMLDAVEEILVEKSLENEGRENEEREAERDRGERTPDTTEDERKRMRDAMPK